MTSFTRVIVGLGYALLAVIALAYCLGVTSAVGLTGPTPF